MGLKNFQYNTILREYDRRQLENKYQADKKYLSLCEEIPELEHIARQIASNSAYYAKQAVFGDENAIQMLKMKNQALSSQKRKLLAAHGYAADYLAVSCRCPDCRDTGYINGKKCHCFKQAVVDLLYAQSNMKYAITAENFSSFRYEYYSDEFTEPSTGLTPYANIRNVTDRCHHYIDYFDTVYSNILLYGNTGVGKTFLTHCIAKELLDTAHTVIYLTSFELFDILEKNKFSRQDEELESREQFNWILDCDLLIIDDLGTELNNAFISSQLYLCMNERHLSRRSTVISTNLSLDDLNMQYSERIFSRITSDYMLLKITGEDIRLKKVFAP